MNTLKINEKINEIFFELFNIEESTIQSSYYTENFFGSKMRLLPGDVVAFLYAVESEFDLIIPASYILEEKFNTLDNVSHIISKILQERKNEIV